MQYPHPAASAAGYRAATSIKMQKIRGPDIAQQHPHSAASAAGYCAATSSPSSLRSRVSRSNIHLDAEKKGSRFWTPYSRSNVLTPTASAAGCRTATSDQHRPQQGVLRSNILTQQRPQQGIAQQHPFRCRNNIRSKIWTP